MSKQAWQSQALDAPPISLEFIQFQVAKVKASWRRELHLMNWGAALGFGAVVFALLRDMEPSGLRYALRIGVSLVALGIVVLTYETRRRIGKISPTPGEGLARSIDVYRSELQRLRDYYLSQWRWALWPMLPGLCAIVVGGILYDTRPGKWIRYLTIFFSAWVGAVISMWVARRQAAAYQRELDALETLERPKH